MREEGHQTNDTASSDTVPETEQKPSAHYEPKDHIQPLEIPPRAEVLLDQREITIQEYRTTIPFDYDALSESLEQAWLTPQTDLGVFSRERLAGREMLSVVLGLQDQLSVQTYDYRRRRPLWFSWQKVIVDTIGIRYVSDENGLLCFRATGGGKRIGSKMLHGFNSSFLGIPEAAVRKREFDLDKLREMCFGRFLERLYMLRFSGPEAVEYESIDHAEFQSRGPIDPRAPRLLEVKTDAEAEIESFQSDIEITCRDLADPARVRFWIKGKSGSLRLSFPKMVYRRQLNGTKEQADVAYRMLDQTVNAILDGDCYARQQPSLEDLSSIPDLMLPGLEDLKPYREAFSTPEAREEFFADLNVDDPHKHNWQPHLQALDELLEAKGVRTHLAELIAGLTVARPQRVVSLLLACDADARIRRVGAVASRAATGELQAVPEERRGQVEEALLAWALMHEDASWDVNTATGEISALGTLRWTVGDLSPDVLHRVVWKLAALVHDRLSSATGDIAMLLRQYRWCMEAARTISPRQSGLKNALRLLAEDKVPRTIDDAAAVLKDPVSDLRELDIAVLNDFGLPLWPAFDAFRQDGKVVLDNVGVGAALAVSTIPDDMLFVENDQEEPVDLLAGASMTLPAPDGRNAIDLQFEKLGRRYRISVPIAEKSPEADDATGTPGDSAPFEEIRAAISVVDKNVGELVLNTAAIARNEYELRQQNAALQELAEGGVLRFATRIDADDFRAFAAVMLTGNRSQAAASLQIPRRTFYDRVGLWRGRGPDYQRMYRMVEWRKKSLRRIKVRLDDSLLGTEIDGQAENPETIRDVLAAIRDGDDARSQDDLLRDILQAIADQNADNWQSVQAELIEILEEEVAPR